MEDEIQHEAVVHAKRAGRQAKHASRNGIKAAQMAVAPVVEEAENLAEDVVFAIKDVTVRERKFVGAMAGAKGVVALIVVAFAAKEAVNAFKTATLVAQGARVVDEVYEGTVS